MCHKWHNSIQLRMTAIRERLKEKYSLNQREKYKATFNKFGKRQGYKNEIRTVLLIDVVDRIANLIAEHLWMDCGKRLDKLKLKNGDMIQFFARVKIYQKGYEGFNEFGEEGIISMDYGLSYPSQIVKLSHKYIIKNK